MKVLPSFHEALPRDKRFHQVDLHRHSFLQACREAVAPIAVGGQGGDEGGGVDLREICLLATDGP
jgi:hypothetical protein